MSTCWLAAGCTPTPRLLEEVSHHGAPGEVAAWAANPRNLKRGIKLASPASKHGGPPLVGLGRPQCRFWPVLAIHVMAGKAATVYKDLGGGGGLGDGGEGSEG